jgi:hypothetical protein
MMMRRLMVNSREALSFPLIGRKAGRRVEKPRPEGEMTKFQNQNIFDFEPQIPGVSTTEPALREIIFSYYRLSLPTSLEPKAVLELSRKYTDEYVAQILEAYFGISRSD